MILNFETHFTKTLKKIKNNNYKFILGLSGGMDSMAKLEPCQAALVSCGVNKVSCQCPAGLSPQGLIPPKQAPIYICTSSIHIRFPEDMDRNLFMSEETMSKVSVAWLRELIKFNPAGPPPPVTRIFFIVVLLYHDFL